MRRAPFVEKIPVDRLITDHTRVHDERFIALYSKWMKGRGAGIYTRISVEKILPGVFQPTPEGTIKRFHEDGEREAIHIVKREIRRGSRFPILVYRGHLPSISEHFICADDMNFYHAYRELGFRLIPVLIIEKVDVSLLDEPGFWVEYRGDKKPPIFKPLENPPKAYRSMIGTASKDKPIDPIPILDMLSELLAQAMKKIEEFHSENKAETQVQYHQTLHSTCYRARETLQAISLLFRHGMHHQARSLVRTLYELFLTFSVDWIAPEIVGPMLQEIAELRRSIDGEEYRNTRKQLREARYPGLDINEKVIERAKLSRLGLSFHQAVYPTLSAIAHQDFGVTEEYAQTLESGKPEPLPNDEVDTLVRWSDIIVATLASMILDEVGSYDAPAAAR